MMHKPCKCGYNRWRTVNKRYDISYYRRYQCRRCGEVRAISRMQDEDNK